MAERRFTATDAILFARELRGRLMRDPGRRKFSLERTEVEMLLVAIDYATDDDEEDDYY